MIIESLVSNKRNLLWTIVHALLAIISTVTPFVFIGWFYLILFGNFNKASQLLKQKKSIYFITLFSYLISFEVLDRMARTSPFIPYELGKYMLVFMGILGITFFWIRSQKGMVMIFLITPALFYDLSHQRIMPDIINYYLGPLAVGLGIAFSDKIKITQYQLDQILKLIYWACFTTLVFTFIKTPDLDEIEFTLGAQFDTTGGHSSNQVSSVLGLGMFLAFYSLFHRKLFSGNYILDIIIFIGFILQGLLSFSRGGMIVGLFGILLMVFTGKRNIFKNGKVLIFTILGTLLLTGAFIIINDVTNGNLSLRYQGETQGTLLGTKEKTADHIVSGRLGIFEKDLELFYKHPLNGVGLGTSKYLRDENEIVAAHVELSRLLADHGILGLIYSVIFFGLAYTVFKYNKLKRNNILFILVFIALATTFHAAMRTFISPLFLIIGSFNLKSDESNITLK
jgi:hypothetical protein